MLTPSDSVYQETKAILLGHKSMDPIFMPLAVWINQTFGVSPIYMVYTYLDQASRPRLEIVFEHPHEKDLFINPVTNVFDREKQHSIGEQFKSILSEQGNPNGYATENYWVIFSDFSSRAKIEANESIPAEKIQALKESFDNDDIWELSRSFSVTTLFFYTDFQVKKYKNSPILKQWSNQYFDLLKQYDPFGYFDRSTFSFYLDSKENFDRNYQSNWYYYYK